MTVSFEAENAEDLKKQITDYAFAHLGLKVQDYLKNYLERDDVKAGKPQGRRLGYRKKEAVAENIVPAKKSDGVDLEPVPATVFPDSSKKDECKQMVAAVMGKFQESLGQQGAFQRAKGCLEEFGAAHLDHLNPASYDNFIEHCKKVMGAR